MGSSMKILYVKAGKINEPSGGGLESYKVLYALEKWILENPKDELEIISEDVFNIKNLNPPVKKKWKDLGARLFFHSSYLYVDYIFGKLKKHILAANYDIIVLGNSRLGFIAKDVKKNNPNTKIIIHYDNIEWDYVDAYLSDKNGLKYLMYKSIEKKSVKRNEKDSIQYGDLHLLLTNRDQDRLKELYKNNRLQCMILPICLKDNGISSQEESEQGLHLLFIGSLWYQSNVVGISWFLDTIWTKIQENYPLATLTIGGSKPNKAFIEKVALDSSIRFFPDFDNIERILFKEMILISPILEGAGMKVKIANALSMGFPFVASAESLVGYEESYQDSLGKGVIHQAENLEEYLESIQEILSQDYSIISNNAKQLFLKYYSLERAVKSFEQILINYKNKKE